MRSRMWIALDGAMLLAVVVLQAWRLTGVVLHEWLAAAVVGGVLAHLVQHWSWVRSRSRRVLRPRSARTRVNFGLNVIVFAAMAAAMVSGVVISKSILPSGLDPSTYLKWRGIHGTTSRVALIAIGLHLALNWDRLFANRPFARLRNAMTAAAWAAVVTAVVGGAMWAVEARMSNPDITLIAGNKRIEHAAPPPDIAKLRPDEAAPNARGWPALAAHSIMLAAACLAGRKLLRLRLD